MPLAEELCTAEVAEFDESSFDQDRWELAGWREQKTRHIGLHIAKLPLKLVQGDTQQIMGEVIPDMALYRTQLVQTHDLIDGIDGALMPLQFPRYLGSYRRPASHREIQETGAQNFALKRAALAGSWLAKYLEPLEHGEPIDNEDRRLYVLDAASNLHVGAVALAKEFDVDLRQSLLQRIAQQSRFLDSI